MRPRTGKTTTVRILLGLARPSAGRAEIFGLDVQRQTVEAHRQVAFVPGEAALWPSLTGAETLHLLGRLHGSFDASYRDQLIDYFRLARTGSRQVGQGLLERQPAEAQLGGGADDPGRPAHPR